MVSAQSSANPHLLAFRDPDVIAGDTYEYRVTAVNSQSFESEPSTSISIIAASPSEPPASIAVSGITTKTASLSWASVT